MFALSEEVTWDKDKAFCLWAPSPEDSDPNIQNHLVLYSHLTLSRNTLTGVPKGPLSSSQVFCDLTKSVMERGGHTSSNRGLNRSRLSQGNSPNAQQSMSHIKTQEDLKAYGIRDPEKPMPEISVIWPIKSQPR